MPTSGNLLSLMDLRVAALREHRDALDALHCLIGDFELLNIECTEVKEALNRAQAARIRAVRLNNTIDDLKKLIQDQQAEDDKKINAARAMEIL